MKVVLYSAVRDRNLFSRVGFYRNDIDALSLHGDEVLVVNSLLQLSCNKPKLFVGYFFSHSFFAALYCRIVGASVLLTGGADQISPVLVSGFRLFIRRTMAFLCILVSHRVLLPCLDDVRNFQKLCFGIHSLERKIELVHHIVNVTSSQPIAYAAIPGEFTAFTICWMGSVSNVKRKGVDKAIRLISLLRRVGVNARLDIAGTDGPGQRYLEDLVHELKLNQQISFLGPISEAEKNSMFLTRSIYLQLSLYEGFGVAAAEAFFSGMLVVHTNKGGLKDVIGSRGLVIDPVIVEKEDLLLVKYFYAKVLSFRIDSNFLQKDLKKYSVKKRSDAFFRGIYV